MSIHDPLEPGAAPPSPGSRAGKGASVAGAALGVIGLALCWVQFVGAGVALVGVIVAALGWRMSTPGSTRWIAIAGVTCGLVGLAIGVVLTTRQLASARYHAQLEARRAKGEANLHAMEKLIKQFYAATGRLPASANIMPGDVGSGCRTSSGTMPARTQSEWSDRKWNELRFHVEGPSEFSYLWTVEGATGVASAFADLECDGRTTVYRLRIGPVDDKLLGIYDEIVPE